MKIAHINMFYLPTFGGVEQVMYELAKRQVQDGHEVHIYCCDSDKNSRINIKEEVIEGIIVHRLSYWFRLSLSTFIWPSLLWRFGNDEKFDIVHTHVSGHSYVLFIGLLSKIKKFKHVHTTHCPWTDASFRPKILRPFIFLNDLILNKISFDMIDRIIAITPWELGILKKYADTKKISVIPNGVDSLYFKKVGKNNFKKKNNITEKYMVLFFGRLNPTKGPEILARAAAAISKKRNDIAFVWVGPDEGKAEEVKTLIKNFKNMHYLGPIRGKEKIAEMYQAADVYVMPSYREGLPLTLFEAMASGLPIIASPVNGIPFEMNRENGLFVEYGDEQKLAREISVLLDDRNLRKKMSNENKKKSKEYDWDIIYRKYMKEYDKLVQNKNV
ncbi:MAG: hypothetical protein RL557_734 [archaeon]